MLLRIQSDALDQIQFDRIQFPPLRVFEIYGDRGALTYDAMTGRPEGRLPSISGEEGLGVPRTAEIAIRTAKGPKLSGGTPA